MSPRRPARGPARPERRDRLDRELPGWVSGALVLGALAAALWLERRRPLRRRTEERARRQARNLAVAALSALTVRSLEQPLARRLARLAHRRRWGLLGRLGLPAWLTVPIAVVLLDYTLYVWHVLTHKVPLLWRFHRVHHADLDLDSTTALRFHFGEMALSVPWRAGQVVLLGVPPLALSLWQTLTLIAILFHHADLELEPGLDRWLSRLVVTPRMHGIHHSRVRRETDSNWSTILSFPDRLHETIRLAVRQDDIVIGAPELSRPEQVTLGRMLALPFRAQASRAER